LVDNQVNRDVITEFGLARRLSHEQLTQTGFLAGTIEYMSPEQSRGVEIDARSDLFSLGSVLFFLATGASPFAVQSPMATIHAIGQTPHPKVQAINNEVSSTLAAIIDRLLEKDPDTRFQTAAEAEDFLSQYLLHLQQPLVAPLPRMESSESPEHENVNGGKKNKRNVLKAVLAAAVSGIIGLGIWWAANFWNTGMPNPSSNGLMEQSNNIESQPNKNINAKGFEGKTNELVFLDDALNDLENDVEVFEMLFSKPDRFWTNRVDLSAVKTQNNDAPWFGNPNSDSQNQ